jgi:hypothetical protein
MLPIGMRPTVVFDLVGESAAAATAALRALLTPFNWPLLRMTTPISRAASRRRYSRRAVPDRYRLSIAIGEGLDDGFDAVEGRDRAAAAFRVVIRNGERRTFSDFAKIR